MCFRPDGWILNHVIDIVNYLNEFKPCDVHVLQNWRETKNSVMFKNYELGYSKSWEKYNLSIWQFELRKNPYKKKNPTCKPI